MHPIAAEVEDQAITGSNKTHMLNFLLSPVEMNQNHKKRFPSSSSLCAHSQVVGVIFPRGSERSAGSCQFFKDAFTVRLSSVFGYVCVSV